MSDNPAYEFESSSSDDESVVLEVNDEDYLTGPLTAYIMNKYGFFGEHPSKDDVLEVEELYGINLNNIPKQWQINRYSAEKLRQHYIVDEIKNKNKWSLTPQPSTDYILNVKKPWHEVTDKPFPSPKNDSANSYIDLLNDLSKTDGEPMIDYWNIALNETKTFGGIKLS